MSGPLVLDADDNALISDWKLSKEEEQDDGWLEGRPDLLPLREPDQKIPPLWTIDDHGQIVLNFHPGQKRAWDATRRVIAIIAGAQSGKALALDTLLPQPRGGYVSMRDIRVGDQVYDAGFNPVTVTYVSPVFRNHECFKLDFSCDDAVVADAEHLWPVGDQLADGTWATITSRELHNRFWRVEDIWIASGSKSARCLEYSQRVNSVDTRCISVDSPSSTYLCTQGYVPTHNTSYAPLWLWREIQRRGAGDYMAVTPTWPLAKKKLLPEIIRFFGDTMHLGKFRPGDRVFEISKDGGIALYGEATNSYIFLGSAISPESLESATAKAVLLDEAGQQQFRLEAWEAVNRRVSLHKGRILITTTPYNLGFLKTEVYDKWLDGDPNITVIQYSSTQNPLFDPTEMERQRQVLPDWKFELFYRGRFAKPSHLIYGSFTDTPAPTGHLIEPFDVPGDWARWIGVDFGGANTALLFVAEHPMSHELFVYDEWMPGPNLSTPETVGEAKRRLQGVSGPITLVGGSQSEGQLRQDWAMAGLAIEEPKIYDVEAGINRGIALLKTKRVGVFKTASGIRSEFGAYSRPTDAKGEVLTGIQHKNRFHRLDAYRYIATWVESGPIGGANLIIISGARDRRLRR